jgi:Glycine-zipper domain
MARFFISLMAAATLAAISIALVAAAGAGTRYAEYYSPPPSYGYPPPNSHPPCYAVTPGPLQGAARGAAGGALFGAIGGNAGRGAAIGAGVGAIAGAVRRGSARSAGACY